MNTIRSLENQFCFDLCIGVQLGGLGAPAPPVLKLFKHNAYDSGKSTQDK